MLSVFTNRQKRKASCIMLTSQHTCMSWLKNEKQISNYTLISRGLDMLLTFKRRNAIINL